MRAGAHQLWVNKEFPSVFNIKKKVFKNSAPNTNGTEHPPCHPPPRRRTPLRMSTAGAGSRPALGTEGMMKRNCGSGALGLFIGTLGKKVYFPA